MKNKFSIINLLFAIICISPFSSFSQSCSTFSGGVGNWQTSNSNIYTTNFDPISGNYLEILDGPFSGGASYIFNNEDFSGDYSNGNFEICFDFFVYQVNNDNITEEVTITFQIFTDNFANQGISAQFETNFTVEEGGGWVNICAPIELAEESIPSNEDGSWSVLNGGGVDDWNELIANLGGVSFDIDYNSEINEILWLDNFCIQPNCPELSISPIWSQFGGVINLCQVDNWRLMVIDEEGNQITEDSGATFLWTNSNGIVRTFDQVRTRSNTLWTLTVTFPNGCQQELEYYQLCCDQELQITGFTCRDGGLDSTEELLNHLGDAPSRPSGYEHANEFTSSLQDDCFEWDPCAYGLTIMQILDGSGNPITDYTSITWSDGIGNGSAIRLGLVNTEYTAVVVYSSPDGTDECSYELSFFYPCPCPAPARLYLQRDCKTLTWSPVPGVNEYIIEYTLNDTDMECCPNPGPFPIQGTITVNENEHTFAWNQFLCASFRVGTVCEDGNVYWSEKICNNCGHRRNTLNLSILPNPSQGRFQVQFKEPIDGEISIVDFKGKLIYENAFQNTMEQTIDISSHEVGQYYLHVKSKNKFATEIIQIQRNN